MSVGDIKHEELHLAGGSAIGQEGQLAAVRRPGRFRRLAGVMPSAGYDNLPRRSRLRDRREEQLIGIVFAGSRHSICEMLPVGTDHYRRDGPDRRKTMLDLGDLGL